MPTLLSGSSGWPSTALTGLAPWPNQPARWHASSLLLSVADCEGPFLSLTDASGPHVSASFFPKSNRSQTLLWGKIPPSSPII